MDALGDPETETVPKFESALADDIINGLMLTNVLAMVKVAIAADLMGFRIPWWLREI